ncbi:MAG: LiaI-LiaF-like domain-containing protein [Candidatus Zhuqueibacterota bacterium]
MSEHKKSIWPGVLLVVFGAILLVNRLTPYHFGWSEIYPLVLLGFGVVLLSSVFAKKDKGAVFPGTILFLLGLFFFLRNFDIIDYYHISDVWPIFFIIFGLGFIAIFITKPSDWGVLIPAAIFLFLGAMFWLNIRTELIWDVWYLVADYWPVVLILIGGGILLGGLKKKRDVEVM